MAKTALYSLTLEGRARFRRMEARADADTSVDTEDYRLMLFLFKRCPASFEEIRRATARPWSETADRVTSLLNRGLIEGTG